MLQIKNIKKEYKTGDLIQTALNDVSLSFRDNEFVSILGPSGSGKTTLLNLVGGLDSYDSGDLIINGRSTKNYRDRDWDTYRNHAIGFVFQSYNLIPHQSILSNVELALTIGGIVPSERKRRAKEALEEVGLGKHIHKKPNQLSGGQMQRVAIARALVNNPDILLADEPTGALDTETSIQIMELLKKVATERLVIMVTHNPELADEYSSRIVKLKDGVVIGDTDPFIPTQKIVNQEKIQPKKKAKMSALTAFALSFNNLKTKKRRTLLTAFAGSIGIIGIGLILSLSEGVNSYIEDLQNDTMASYPIEITAESINMSGMMPGEVRTAEETVEDREGIYSDYSNLEMAASMVISNNLTGFKTYIEDSENGFMDYVSETGVIYSYDIPFTAYSYNENGSMINTNDEPSELLASEESAMQGQGVPGMSQGQDPFMAMLEGTSSAANNFEELVPGAEGELVNQGTMESYDILYGDWPQNLNEVILFVDEKNEVSVDTLYQLGLMTGEEYETLAEAIENEEEVTATTWNYEEVIHHEFYVKTASDNFLKNEAGTYTYLTDDYYEENENVVKEGTQLKIVGVAQQKEDATENLASSTIGYTSALTDYLIEHTSTSQIIVEQEGNQEIDVLTGEAFVTEGDQTNSLEENLALFGKVNYDTPSAINIYTDSFEDKENVSLAIEEYNKTASEENQIVYTDYIEVLTSSMMSMIDVISYVLIAFVGVSLVVSCIMIGIITHISVMERTKEIGVLRALGASKANISQVFNAETMLIGLCSGLLGVGITLLANIPITAIIRNLLGSSDIATALPTASAVVLIAISVVITIVGGLVPARSASHKDPVIALRSE